MYRNKIHRIIQHVRLGMAKKIVHHGHRESTKMLLELWSFTAVFTKITQNHVTCANRQVDREWVAIKKPIKHGGLHQSNQRPFAVFVDYHARFPSGETFRAYIAQLFSTCFPSLLSHGRDDQPCTKFFSTTYAVPLSVSSCVWRPLPQSPAPRPVQRIIP